jgi:cell division protein FtsZ
LITIPGLINCDFADVRTVMLEMGDALMGTGAGKGDEKAIDAAQEAISSPLLENVSIAGAQGVLINVTGGEDMTLHDVNTATSLIYEQAGDNANIIFGAVIDPDMKDGMRVTVIATGIGKEDVKPVVKEEPVVQEVKPGKVMSLFPDERPQQEPKKQVAQGGSSMSISPQPEPEESRASYSEQEDYSSGGNGNGSSLRGRVPVFSEDDRTIPAYIRRLDEDR